MTRSNTARRMDIGDDALADPGDEVKAAERRTGEQDDDTNKEKNSAVKRRHVAALEPLIDEPPQPLTEAQHGRRGDEKSQHRAGHVHPVRQGEWQNPAECRKIARWRRRK